MSDLVRTLEDIDIGMSWLAAAAIAILAVAAAGLTRRATAYHAADRGVGPLVSGLAAFAAFLSAAPFLGLAGVVFALGSDGLAWLVGLGAGLVLMAVLVAPAFRASGALTVPEFLGARFGGRLVPLLAAAIVGAVCLALLIAQLAAIGTVAERHFALSRGVAISGATILLAITLCGGGLRGATWLAAGLAVAILAAYLAPLGALAVAHHGSPVGPIAYGQTLSELRELEVDLISAGLADADSLKPHLSQFLQVDHSNTLALIVTIMTGTAVLPHVLMRQAVTSDGQQTRMAMAWMLLFSTLVLVAIPAYAAISKHELYRQISKGVPVTETPVALAQANVGIYGVPFGLYEAVANAMTPGGEGLANSPPVTYDRATIGERLNARSPQEFAAWAALKPEVQQSLADAASGAGSRSQAQRFEAWRTKVLPVAARAAGGASDKLTLAALSVAPDRAVVLGLDLAGLHRGWSLLFALGAVLAAFATALATAWAVARSLGADLPGVVRGATPTIALASPEARRTAGVRLAALVTLMAAAIAALRSEVLDFVRILAWSMSVLAAGLFPVLVFGIWWRRATAAGALAGMMTGLVVTLGYIGGIQLAPDAMPRLELPAWHDSYALRDDPQTFADAADADTAELSGATGQGAAEPAFGDDPATPEAIEPPAGDTATAPALDKSATGPAGAAWFGIADTAAAVFGLPLGCLVLILVSLMTRRPTAADETFVWAIRRPGA